MNKRKTNVLLPRQQVVAACLKRFDKKPRQYGSVDCAQSSAFVLRKAGVKIPFLKGQTYGSLRKAREVMEATGCATLVECLDALGLQRIAPLATLPGDIIALPVPEGDPFGASLMTVHTAGAHRAFGFDPLTSCFEVGVPDLSSVLAAWSVPHG